MKNHEEIEYWERRLAELSPAPNEELAAEILAAAERKGKGPPLPPIPGEPAVFPGSVTPSSCFVSSLPVLTGLAGAVLGAAAMYFAVPFVLPPKIEVREVVRFVPREDFPAEKGENPAAETLTVKMSPAENAPREESRPARKEKDSEIVLQESKNETGHHHAENHGHHAENSRHSEENRRPENHDTGNIVTGNIARSGRTDSEPSLPLSSWVKSLLEPLMPAALTPAGGVRPQRAAANPEEPFDLDEMIREREELARRTRESANFQTNVLPVRYTIEPGSPGGRYASPSLLVGRLRIDNVIPGNFEESLFPSMDSSGRDASGGQREGVGSR
ncbi:MAG: hypothetical protein LBQ54_10305 [Planctomycetaceae bacterium]|jgi:hypothetical protein|nr:hypothetical protein [Planctomycetaceae bacterium]